MLPSIDKLNETLASCDITTLKSLSAEAELELAEIANKYDNSDNINGVKVREYIDILRTTKKLCNDRVRFHELTQDDINLFKSYKYRIDEATRNVIMSALLNEMLTADELTLFNKQLKYIKKAIGVVHENRRILEEINATQYLLTDDDYTEVKHLLAIMEDWSDNCKRIVDTYKAIKANKNAINIFSDPKYALICNEIAASKVKCDFIQRFIPQNRSLPLTNKLDSFIKLSQEKTETGGLSLLKSEPNLRAFICEINSVLVECIVVLLEDAYNNLTPIDINDFADAVSTESSYPDAFVLRSELVAYDEREYANKESITKERWFTDCCFGDIKPHITTCLSASLNGFNHDMFYDVDALSHPALIGIIEWSAEVSDYIAKAVSMQSLSLSFRSLAWRLRKYIRHNVLFFEAKKIYGSLFGDFGNCSDEQNRRFIRRDFFLRISNYLLDIMRDDIKVCVPMPLPNAKAVNKKKFSNQSVSNMAKPRITDNSFNLSKKFQPYMKTLDPDTVVTDYKKEVTLTAEEVQSLVVVEDHIIRYLLRLFMGERYDDVVMLDGRLLVSTNGKYTEILPVKRKDGYPEFILTAVNRKTFTLVNNGLADFVYGEDDCEHIFPTFTDEEDYFSGFGLESSGHLNYSMRNFHTAIERRKKLCREATALYKDTSKMPLVSSLIHKRVYKTFNILQHHLVAWVYYPDDYQKLVSPPIDSQGNREQYEIDHKDNDRGNFHPDNLHIILKSINAGKTSSSISVTYNGQYYINLIDYCRNTKAGSYISLQQQLKALAVGSSTTIKGRIYNKNKSRYVIVTDAKIQWQSNIVQVDFRGVTYNTIADFAKAANLDYGNLRKRLSRAQKSGTVHFTYQKLSFAIVGSNFIKVI